jgi:antitoxin ParD1/3/4
MNISLTPQLEKLVTEKLKTGLYSSASEVIREGLRLLAEADKLKADRLADLRSEIEAGYYQARRGELLDGPKAIAKIRSRSPGRRKRT